VAGLLLVDALGTLGRAALWRPTLIGAGALLLLGIGQVWGPQPQTWLLTGGSAVVPEMAATAPAVPQEVRFLDGQLVYHTDRVPMSGQPGARIILLEFFDYTCASCRTLAGDLKELQKKWPGTFGVIALPAPLNRSCNPDLKPIVPDHEGACELAKLSLAVWKAKPAAFSEFHDYLLALPLPASPERLAEARRQAAALAGGAAVVAALADPSVSQQLSENFAAYGRLTTQSIAMPKLLLPSSGVMHGLAQNTATFIKLMESQFKLTASGAAK
jgi:thiol-disulfide isomerase/thioredoxin